MPANAPADERVENCDPFTNSKHLSRLPLVFTDLRDLLNSAQTPDAPSAPPLHAIGFRSQRK